jgi:phosphate:Na+ symporter
MEYGFTDVLTLLGALGLFLYGMKVMSDALMELAGDRMRNILATTTSTRFFAVVTGFLITAAIQSSSATTLMVVGFANASLLSLTEAIGVIMGANIGTTVKAWLISILGFKVSMAAITVPLVGAGFLLSLSKRRNRKQCGYFIIGFAVLFIGLDFLKDAVPDLRNNPDALAFLAEYTNKGYLSVFLFLAIGTILTLIIQSSSAMMALTLLMCYEGWIPLHAAAAMVLGENIGTTITANLASLVANFQAKRAARAHLIFNLIGVSWMLLLFYPFLDAIDVVVQRIENQSPLVSATAIPVALALFHTTFNVLNTALLIGFVPLIARITERMVPAVKEKERDVDEPRFLSDASLKFPQTGIKALIDESLRLLENAGYEIIAHGLDVHRTDIESGQKLKQIVRSSDAINIDIDRAYATKIKTIYSRILEYATSLQSRFSLDQEKITAIRNILIADRMLVEVVKEMKPLHTNVDRFIASNNLSIRREYNRLRRRILKVLREIHRAGPAEHREHHMEKLEKWKTRATELDVLLTGRVDKLIIQGVISNEMATSLMNDSASATRITEKLVDIATLLYSHRDALLAGTLEDEVPSEGTGEITPEPDQQTVIDRGDAAPSKSSERVNE